MCTSHMSDLNVLVGARAARSLPTRTSLRMTVTHVYSDSFFDPFDDGSPHDRTALCSVVFTSAVRFGL